MEAILLVDNVQDEVILNQTLRLAHFSVRSRLNIEQLLREWSNNSADLLVTAIQFSDPVAVVRRIRSSIIVPLIVIVDSLNEELHVQTVEAGADLVLGRPYSVRLIICYANSLVRRTDGVHRLSLPPVSAHCFTLDPASRTVRIPGKPEQRLTQLEFRLLHILMNNKDQVLPVDLIIERVWGYTGEGDRNMVRNLIHRLRTKVEPDPTAPAHIATVPGIGYRFQDSYVVSHPHVHEYHAVLPVKSRT